MSDEIVRTEPGGQNGALAKLNPQWFAEIKDVDESLFVSNDELFRKSRAELKDLREKMQQMLPVIQESNNAFARFRFSSQMQILDVWMNWLDGPLHGSFDAAAGYKLLEWIKQSKGDVPITPALLDEAYARLKAPVPIPEPEAPPTIIVQPKSVEAAPLEMASFNVVAQGSGPLSYQWLIAFSLVNVQEIPGEDAKRSSYQTVASEYSDGSLYCCRVSNKFGSVVSYPARLTMKK
jgi:hypothetical protein